MMKLSISQLTTLRWSTEEDVAAYRRHGFSAVGLWRPKLDELGIERTAELLADNDMAVSSLSWAGGFTGSDGRGHEESIEDGIEAVRAAEVLGAETLIVLAGGANNHIHGHAMRLLQQGLQAIFEEARGTGVSVALEPIHPGCGDEWSFVGDIRSTLEVIEALPRADVGLVLDAYHLAMNVNAPEDLDWLEAVVPFLRLVQLGDAKQTPLGEQNRCLLGQGRVPLREIVSVLAAAGYDGYYEIELLGEDVEPLPYDQVLDHTRQYFQEHLACD
ncbi:sugar phosphate isomerase/epimerase family protein [Roseimaritima sediminicola]|uniref:sugar phosphate isomerase/epimerase family protein n=1 Tax=Roseimaritima sediminicola TaxID=2662066 RepID=UPI0012983CAF|nr:sugar phosphate isomerase/epimerase family protein [Roseimaritima sediminicola]